ncbi:MAG TPA: L-aspartate oxidase, partial [Pirellulales bacterium]|nr:L-aspartate oxidase [Pirellulales bacterium]
MATESLPLLSDVPLVAGEAGPRYLVRFDPKRVSHHFTDVLIIGGGLAGLRAALAIDPRMSVLVITKDSLLQSNSNYAQGGIAGVLDPEDRFENHVADTLRAGGQLCDREVVEMVVREAPERIGELMSWGAHFDQEAGSLALGREGGHSHDRIVHALGDATGKEVMRAVIDRARSLPNLATWQDTFTLDLLTWEGACRGALVWNAAHGKTLVWAKQTILCTGGAGQLYRETTNPAVATGDGYALAYRAGAQLRDMEFMQFHPTVLYIAGSSRNLITEAMRGEGAHLVDRLGRRFMADYDARGELAPRDVVSQAIVTQMEKTRHPNVYLELSHLDPERISRRFPGISAICAEFGIDITSDWIPVRPGAHYMIGGVTVDRQGRTTLAGLWAAGEVTSSGLHGANRLAS